MKSVVIVGIVLWFAASSVYSEDNSKKWQLSCAALDTQNRFLSVSNGTEIVFLTEFRFEGSPFVESRLSCAQWVEYVESKVPDFQITSSNIKRLLTNENKPAGRLEGDVRNQLFELCNSHPFCQIRFPYNVRLGVDVFFGASAKSGFTQPKVCFEKSTEFPKLEIQNVEEVFLNSSAQSVATWTSPPQSFGLEVEKVISHPGNDLIILTALGASWDELNRLKKKIPPNKKMLVLLDFYIFLTESRLPDFINLQADNFFILPMFNTPQYRRAYHIKGAAGFDSRTPGVITSSNIKDQANRDTFDFGITFQGALGRELGEFLVRDAIDACMQLPYAQCTLEQRYAAGSPFRQGFEQMFFRTCQMLKQSNEVRLAIAAEPALHFLGTNLFDVEALIAKLIAKTKKNIVIVSDQVGHEDILQKLNEAAKRGVNVEVFYGKDPLMDVSKYNNIRFLKAYNAIVKNHAKGILFDDQKLLMGSGNLTKTGLNQAREVFLLTEQTEILAGFRDYLKTIKKTFALDLQ